MRQATIRGINDHVDVKYQYHTSRLTHVTRGAIIKSFEMLASYLHCEMTTIQNYNILCFDQILYCHMTYCTVLFSTYRTLAK